MKTNYIMRADEFKLGDVFCPTVDEETQQWGYYWRSEANGEWIAAPWTDMAYASKDAAKRAVSRMVRHSPNSWENVEFAFVRFFS